MVRHYTGEPVAPEAVRRIAETIRRAPSAGYSQGQRLLVVTEDAGRADVARALGEAGWTAPEGREPWLETAPSSAGHSLSRSCYWRVMCGRRKSVTAESGSDA